MSHQIFVTFEIYRYRVLCEAWRNIDYGVLTFHFAEQRERAKSATYFSATKQILLLSHDMDDACPTGNTLESIKLSQNYLKNHLKLFV